MQVKGTATQSHCTIRLGHPKRTADYRRNNVTYKNKENKAIHT